MAPLPLPTKILWRLDLSRPWEQTFYPSLVKKILKSAAFNEYFYTEIKPFQKSLFDQHFLPLYEAQIASRSDYRLNEEQMLSTIYERMNQGISYEQFSVFEKKSNQYRGGVIYSIRSDYISVALRVFDRDIPKVPTTRTTLDYWAESVFFEKLRTYGKTFIRHGKDTHPRFGHSIGLSLYKLSIGAKPLADPEAEIKTWNPERQNEPILFFDQPNSTGIYTKANLYHPKAELENTVQTLKSVCPWTGIELRMKI